MQVLFDDAEFDRIVHGSLPHCGEEHFALVVKDNATVGGAPAVCITFVSETAVGPKRVQMVVTARNLIQALSVLVGKYEYLSERKHAPADTAKELSGHFAGVGWNAVFMERMYLVVVENGLTGIAATEDDARAVAKGLCESK